QTKRVEVLTSGTVNPWGHDWTAEGEMFFVNTVIGHLWHMLPGAHYTRREPRDPYQHVYEMIAQHADHYHFDTGQDWTKSRHGAADSLGGGHAHSGAMIYLGDNWPAEYRGRLFTLNLHGRRINQELLQRKGSGYVGRHGEDIALSDDKWFRGIDLSYGPDGGVFVLDWSDAGECHENDGVHRTSGRIYKVIYEGTERAAAAPPVDLYKASDRELVDLQAHSNEWFVRQSRLELARRAANGKLAEDTVGDVRKRFEQSDHSLQQLRLLLTLHAVGAADAGFLKQQLQHKDEHIRTWAIRCLTETWQIDGPLGPLPIMGEYSQREKRYFLIKTFQPLLVEMAKQENSPLVRLTLASTLQRLPIAQRAELAAALASHAADAEDHNLPLMVWYGLIPVEPAELVDVFHASQWPKLRQFIARRLTEELSDDAAPVNALLATSAEKASVEARRDLSTGMQQAMRGWHGAKPPEAWAAFKQSIEGDGQAGDSKLKCEQVSLVFGDPRALAALQKMAGDEQIAGGIRQQALQSIIDAKPADLRPTCERLLRDTTVGMIAARGLATFPDAEAADRMIAAYPAWGPHERQGLLSLLVSRKAFAERLLAGIAAEQVSRTDVTAYHIRQIHSLKDADLSRRAAEVWGTVNETPQAKRQAIARWKEKFDGEAPAGANIEQGKELYKKSCAQCHRLYGEGGQIGPDLTGANRNNLHYLLENIIHPSAEVSADYRMTVLTLEDGRVLNGLITAESDRTVTLQSPTEEFVVPRESIESNERTNLSPMPEGLLEQLSEEQVRDLIAYLMKTPAQSASE
ncbi:MAG: PVC-type heme-binding CxxCH protein, partial [Pirellulales bacterium]